MYMCVVGRGGGNGQLKNERCLASSNIALQTSL